MSTPKKGDRVLTKYPLGDISGVAAPQKFFDARSPDAFGTILNGLPGYGMEVFWVAHGPSLEDPEPVGIYAIDEFTLMKEGA